MVCAPTKTPTTRAGDAFAFGPADDAQRRAVENMTTLMLAPWRAWCALAIESMDHRNHGLPAPFSPRA